MEIYGDGDKIAGLEFIKNDLTNVDIGSHYIGRAEGVSIKDFVWENIQDALFTSAVVNSGVAVQGEETLNNILDMKNANQVIQRNPEIQKTADAFLKYLQEGMSE